jgi:hypothetical protein
MATTRMKKSEAVHRLWELADSEKAIIYLSDCLFVYLSGEERMEDTLNRASTQYLVESKAPAQAVQSKKRCLPSFSLKLKLSLLA